MIDQILIGDKASFDDFNASVAGRFIGLPKKKSIKATVPFSNVTHDFSAINGELYWEDRELEYVFEIMADDPEELEELKSKFAAWVMNTQGANLHDPHIPDYHFQATYDDMKVDDDEGMDKTTLTVTFTAYPFKIANEPKVYEKNLGSKGYVAFYMINESDHPVALTFVSGSAFTAYVGGNGDNKISFPAGGTWISGAYKIPPGEKVASLEGAVDDDIKVIFYEEVF